MDKENRKKLPGWLKRTQELSWEPEILLSGFVLVGLFRLPDGIDLLRGVMVAELLYGSWSGVFLAFKQAVYVLIIGLIIHLFLRGIWVGFVGLSFTFPKGIRPEKFNYQAPFIKEIAKIPPFEKQIENLEKVCSSIFAICFFLMMILIGAIIGTTLLFFFTFLLDKITFGAISSLVINYFQCCPK